MMTFDPRKLTRPPQTAQPAQASRQPFPEGTIIGKVPKDAIKSDGLTDLERRVIEQAQAGGISDVDLADTDAGKRIAKEVERIRNAAQTISPDEIPDRPAVAPPVETDFMQLSDAERDEIVHRIEATKAAADAQSRRAVPPGAQNIKGIENVWDTIVDEATGVEPPPPAAEQRVQGKWYGPSNEDPPPPPPAPPVKAKQPVQSRICQHCGCDATTPAVKIEDIDKAAYLAMILGGTFQKQYTLYDGHVQVVFRNLTPTDNELINAYLYQEVLAKRVQTLKQHSEIRTVLSMLVSLAKISWSNGNSHDLNALHTYATGPDTLVELKKWMYAHVVTSDSVQRVLLQVWREFNLLLDELDSKKDLKDFFSNIVPAPSC